MAQFLCFNLLYLAQGIRLRVTLLQSNTILVTSALEDARKPSNVAKSTSNDVQSLLLVQKLTKPNLFSSHSRCIIAAYSCVRLHNRIYLLCKQDILTFTIVLTSFLLTI
jgi:hypothetical protein